MAEEVILNFQQEKVCLYVYFSTYIYQAPSLNFILFHGAFTLLKRWGGRLVVRLQTRNDHC